MTTRHAFAHSAPAPERYMSAPQFAELRGIQGNLVAEKSRLYSAARHREMLFFLHAESLKPGGIRALAARILTEFPHLLGSATMHARGMKPGGRYSEEDMVAIARELGLHAYEWCRDMENYGSVFDPEAFTSVAARLAALADRPAWTQHPKNSVEFLLEACRYKASGDESRVAGEHATSRAPHPAHPLATLLEELCINPDLDFEAIESGAWIQSAGYIAKLWDVLTTCKKQAEAACASEVTTSIGAALCDTLDYALRNGRLVIVEGLAGSGKTTAAEAWVRRHPGRARFVSLSGIMHRTGFFQKIATAIGLATCQRKSSELQAKIEAFFQLSGLMLVIDEAHHAWPKTKRVTVAPEIIDWINTALVNAGVPVALICTPQFRHYKEQVERQTGWNSDQLMHRCKRFTVLPETPTEGDLKAVAAHLLSAAWDEAQQRWQPGEVDADNRAVRFAVAYAKERQTMKIAAVSDAVAEARDLALSACRVFVTAADMVAAVDDRQKPSDAALKAVFEPSARAARARRAMPAPLSRSKAFVGDDEPTSAPVFDSVPATAHRRSAATPLPARRADALSAAP